MIVAGLAPAILGDMADNIGRRIVYLFMMGVYCLANVGLALQSDWTALFLLRMLQSTGSAGERLVFQHLLIVTLVTEGSQRLLQLATVWCQTLLPPLNEVHLCLVWSLGEPVFIFSPRLTVLVKF